mgnify:FL=1
MKKIEPLLKDEEDKFYFLQDKKEEKGKKKFSKETIGTIIISALVLWLMWYSFYPFYIGFVNYDEGHDIVTKTKEKEEEIPTTSVIVNDAYSYIDATNSNALSNAFTEIYSGLNITADTIDSNLKLAIIFKYLGITCENTEAITTLDKITSIAEKIFKDTSFVQNISNLNGQKIYGYNVTFENDGYKITLDACNVSNDYTYKKINKVTASENYLNIYESFGYFMSNENNGYNVYDTALKQNVLTTYSGNVKDFNNTNLLKEYKWTYKKDANGNYYFVSLNYSK